MKPTHLASLLNSPSWIATILKYFLHGAQKIKSDGVPIEIVYLSIPFIFNESIVKELSHGNKNSSFSKFTTNHSLRGEFLVSRDLISYYRPFINKGLIILGSSLSMKINNKILISNYKVNLNDIKNEHVKLHCKAAYNLGAMLAKENTVELLVRFGAN